MDQQANAIEHNVPISTYNRDNKRSRGYSERLRNLQPGNSTLLEGTTIRSIAPTCRRILGTGNYTSRSVSGGVRVWRKSAMLRVVQHLIRD